MSVDIDGLPDGGTFTAASVMEGQTGGVSGKHTGTQLWEGMRDLSCLEKYTVGPAGCAYTTITAAIAAAVGDGATEVDPKLILVVPGAYAESFTVPTGIYIVGMPPDRSFAVEITGTITVSAAPLVGPKGLCGLQGLTVVGGSGGCLIITGTGSQNVYIANCSLQTSTPSTCVIVNNTHADSDVLMRDSRLTTSGTGLVLDHSAIGLIEAVIVSFDQNTSSDNTCISMTAGTLSSSLGEINGRVLVGAGATANMASDSFVGGGTLSAIDIAAGGTVVAGQVAFTTTASPTITGAAGGILVYANLYWDPTGAGGGIDVTMGAGIVPLRTALEVEYTPATPGDWSVAPTTVRGALDAIAANLSPV